MAPPQFFRSIAMELLLLSHWFIKYISLISLDVLESYIGSICLTVFYSHITRFNSILSAVYDNMQCNHASVIQVVHIAAGWMLHCFKIVTLKSIQVEKNVKYIFRRMEAYEILVVHEN
jgi:hypothetical protein